MALFDIEKEFNNKENIKEIKMKDTIKITATTVTPLLQISEAGGQRKRYVYEDGVRGQIPFFSANGLKGGLRRVAFKQQAAKCSDPKSISPETFYLYTSGASLDKTAIEERVTPQNEKSVREQSPILNIFGGGLSALEGIIAVADISPSVDMDKWGFTEDGRSYSLLTGKETFFRSDSSKDTTLYRNLIDEEDIKGWSRDYANKVAESKGKKKSGEAEKEENSHIQQPVNMDYIIPGVKLTSSINTKYGNELSDVEAGCIISALRELSVMQIGSAKRISFGLLNWTVEMGGEVLFRTECTPDYVLERTCTVSDSGEKYIQAWNEWLDENADKMDLEKLVS